MICEHGRFNMNTSRSLTDAARKPGLSLSGPIQPVQAIFPHLEKKAIGTDCKRVVEIILCPASSFVLVTFFTAQGECCSRA